MRIFGHKTVLLLAVSISLSAAHSAFAKPKSNVTGEVKLILEDGKEHNCARRTIFAIPADEDMIEQLHFRFGEKYPVYHPLGTNYYGQDEDEKAVKAHKNKRMKLKDYRFSKRTKKTKCNNDRLFSFTNLKPGDWYIYSRMKIIDKQILLTVKENLDVNVSCLADRRKCLHHNPEIVNYYEYEDFTTLYKGGILVSKITVDGLTPIHVVLSHDERD